MASAEFPRGQFPEAFSPQVIEAVTGFHTFISGLDPKIAERAGFSCFDKRPIILRERREGREVSELFIEGTPTILSWPDGLWGDKINDTGAFEVHVNFLAVDDPDKQFSTLSGPGMKFVLFSTGEGLITEINYSNIGGPGPVGMETTGLPPERPLTDKDLRRLSVIQAHIQHIYSSFAQNNEATAQAA